MTRPTINDIIRPGVSNDVSEVLDKKPVNINNDPISNKIAA
jgi:hypothetical protein